MGRGCSEIDVKAEYDVIVCGGGPAGVSAAVSAARQGARTLLLEVGGCLGGIWTQGMAGLVLDVEGKGGLLREIKGKLAERNAILPKPRTHPHNFLIAGEAMKLLLEELCLEADVDLLYHTRVVEAMIGDGQLKGAILENCEGRSAYAAKILLDCTGNGEFAARAGCEWEAGHPVSGKLQPATMLAIVTGVPEDAAEVMKGRVFYEFLQELGFDPSSKDNAPSINQLPYPELYMFSVNHEFNVRFDSAQSITQATLRARREICDAIEVLRERVGWKDLRLAATPSLIGLREGRRIRGRYYLSVEDIIAGRRFVDGVCTVRAGVDVHALDASATVGAGTEGIKTKPYHIPYRSLVSAAFDNLGMAGRCISGDFYAHSSYRMTGNAVPMGEAIGYAAAVAVRTQRTLAELDGCRVSEEMKARGYAI